MTRSCFGQSTTFVCTTATTVGYMQWSSENTTLYTAPIGLKNRTNVMVGKSSIHISPLRVSNVVLHSSTATLTSSTVACSDSAVTEEAETQYSGRSTGSYITFHNLWSMLYFQ